MDYSKKFDILLSYIAYNGILNGTLSTVVYLLMKEEYGEKMEDRAFLTSHFPICMKKRDLVAKLKENQGVVNKKSRRELANDLETFILFSIREDRRK